MIQTASPISNIHLLKDDKTHLADNGEKQTYTHDETIKYKEKVGSKRAKI